MSYLGLDLVILTAGLVPPKPNIFGDDVLYLVVLATPASVVILAAEFTGGVDGELTLHDSTLKFLFSLNLKQSLRFHQMVFAFSRLLE